MKSPHLLLLLGALWLGGTARSAADGDTATLTTAGSLPELLKPCDLDGDGKLSVEERQAYDGSVKEAVFQQKVLIGKLLWDTNGDGVVSDDERAAAADAIRLKIEASRCARFDELDKNEDGKLSAAEFLNVPNIKARTAARILSRLDTNRDGFISKTEFLNALAQGPVSVTPVQVRGPLTLTPGAPAPATVNATSTSTSNSTTTTPATGTGPTGTSAPFLAPSVPATSAPNAPCLKKGG